MSNGRNSKRVALITGVSGQDGSYLAEFLLSKGYEVHGLMKKSSSAQRIQHLLRPEPARLRLHYHDMGDVGTLTNIVGSVAPTEVYNLASQSSVKISFHQPELTGEVNGMNALRLLEALRASNSSARLFQASTNDLYGGAESLEVPQTESTPFHPSSPYSVSKLYAHWSVVNYREAYGMFACNGVMFNHESPRRGDAFVTSKITRAAARIHLGLQDTLELGNLDAQRDWGHARDYAEAMWLTLQAERATDYIIGTGDAHTVREFVECAFAAVGIRLAWAGEGVNEIGTDVGTGEVRVKVNEQFYRPVEVGILVGDSTKARRELGWRPRTPFNDLVKEMVEADMKRLLPGK